MTQREAWQTWAAKQLADIRARERWREPVPFDGVGLQGIVRGQSVVSFASNDYLGLSHHPAVRAAALQAIEQCGAGAGAARLITGTRNLHVELETALARWQHAARALVFPTGYAANLAVLAVLGESDVTVFSDALNHASIVDGCRLAKARVEIYRHGDLDHLSSLLTQTHGRKLVVTDAVFSMDGDVAPLSALAQLCAAQDALLVIDEAHAVLQAPSQLDCEVVRVGTLSKALGSQGGWVAASNAIIDLLVNRARTFIFTTALAPANAAAALAALNIVTGAEGDTLRTQLRQRIDVLQPAHPSPIIPLILGSERATLDAAEHLLRCGLLIPAVRPPTVPAGASRLRIALSAAHSMAEVTNLKQALAGYRAHLPSAADETTART